MSLTKEQQLRKRARRGDILSRVRLIEDTLPPHPKHYRTGESLPYYSERYQQVEQMIGFCRLLCEDVE